MLEGIGLLFVGYGLVLLWTAILEFRNLLAIKKNGKSVMGTVTNDRAIPNVKPGLMGGAAYRAVIRYVPVKNKPMELWLRGHNLLMKKKFEIGQHIEIVYDENAPERAYPILHWTDTVRDIWVGAAALVGGFAMIVLGRIFLSSAG